MNKKKKRILVNSCIANLDNIRTMLIMVLYWADHDIRFTKHDTFSRRGALIVFIL